MENRPEILRLTNINKSFPGVKALTDMCFSLRKGEVHALVGEGIGGPHIGYDMVWPMSIMMKAFTSRDDAEIKTCIKMLMDTDAGTGFMHESFHKDDATNFTRPWFAWQNTLFGELILKLVNEGKVDLLNNID